MTARPPAAAAAKEWLGGHEVGGERGEQEAALVHVSATIMKSRL
jgi:hypothetical protein